ncbi:MAG: hypothetical protein H7Y33_13105 [Cytophagales bacterium]|nr:hypothetical protein [Rhizobacter sp.]
MTAAKTPVKTARKNPVATPAKAAAKRAAPIRPRATPVKKPSASSAVPKSTTAAGRAEKPRVKLVRDSFTMPHQDFDLIPALKKRALAFQRPAKKSELLRAGLQVLAALDDAHLKVALDALVAIKAGRPKKVR